MSENEWMRADDAAGTMDFNPIEFMVRTGMFVEPMPPDTRRVNNVIYAPEMATGFVEYKQGNDGTFTFVMDMVAKIMSGLFESKHRPAGVEENRPLLYAIGDMHVEEVGVDKMPMKCGGEYPGVKQTFRIPVSCVGFADKVQEPTP
jgi:hypothetical protein